MACEARLHRHLYVPRSPPLLQATLHPQLRSTAPSSPS